MCAPIEVPERHRKWYVPKRREPAPPPEPAPVEQPVPVDWPVKEPIPANVIYIPA